MNWLHLLEWLNVSITVRREREREKCHLGYFRKHNLSTTLSFAFQFGEAAVWKCNRTSIECEFTLDTQTHTMTTKATFFFIIVSHSFKKFITMTVLILWTWKFAVVVSNIWSLWKYVMGVQGEVKLAAWGQKWSHMKLAGMWILQSPPPQPPTTSKRP